MGPEQIILVKHTWKMLRNINPDIVGGAFYGKLFADSPALRRMFPADMGEQYRKLMEVLSIIVARLDHLDDLSTDIAAMAQRHASYGARPAHYQLVGKALLWTLEQGLGKDWTTDVRDAWIECYTTLANKMMTVTAGQTVK